MNRTIEVLKKKVFVPSTTRRLERKIPQEPEVKARTTIVRRNQTASASIDGKRGFHHNIIREIKGKKNPARRNFESLAACMIFRARRISASRQRRRNLAVYDRIHVAARHRAGCRGCGFVCGCNQFVGHAHSGPLALWRQSTVSHRYLVFSSLSADGSREVTVASKPRTEMSYRYRPAQGKK